MDGEEVRVNDFESALKRIEELTGVEDITIEDAIEEWESNRQALADLHDSVQALQVYCIRMRRSWELADTIIEAADKKEGAKLGPKIKAMIRRHAETRELFKLSVRGALDVIREDVANGRTKLVVRATGGESGEAESGGNETDGRGGDKDTS